MQVLLWTLSEDPLVLFYISFVQNADVQNQFKMQHFMHVSKESEHFGIWMPIMIFSDRVISIYHGSSRLNRNHKHVIINSVKKQTSFSFS